MSVTDFPTQWELHCAGRCKESCSYCTMDTSVPVLTESEDPHEEPKNYILPATSIIFGPTTTAGIYKISPGGIPPLTLSSLTTVGSAPREITVELARAYDNESFTIKICNSDGSITYGSYTFAMRPGDTFTFSGVEVP